MRVGWDCLEHRWIVGRGCGCHLRGTGLVSGGFDYECSREVYEDDQFGCVCEAASSKCDDAVGTL